MTTTRTYYQIRVVSKENTSKRIFSREKIAAVVKGKGTSCSND